MDSPQRRDPLFDVIVGLFILLSTEMALRPQIIRARTPLQTAGMTHFPTSSTGAPTDHSVDFSDGTGQVTVECTIQTETNEGDSDLTEVSVCETCGAAAMACGCEHDSDDQEEDDYQMEYEIILPEAHAQAPSLLDNLDSLPERITPEQLWRAFQAFSQSPAMTPSSNAFSSGMMQASSDGLHTDRVPSGIVATNTEVVVTNGDSPDADSSDRQDMDN